MADEIPTLDESEVSFASGSETAPAIDVPELSQEDVSFADQSQAPINPEGLEFRRPSFLESLTFGPNGKYSADDVAQFALRDIPTGIGTAAGSAVGGGPTSPLSYVTAPIGGAAGATLGQTLYSSANQLIDAASGRIPDPKLGVSWGTAANGAVAGLTDNFLFNRFPSISPVVQKTQLRNEAAEELFNALTPGKRYQETGREVIADLNEKIPNFFSFADTPRKSVERSRLEQKVAGQKLGDISTKLAENPDANITWQEIDDAISSQANYHASSRGTGDSILVSRKVTSEKRKLRKELFGDIFDNAEITAADYDVAEKSLSEFEQKYPRFFSGGRLTEEGQAEAPAEVVREYLSRYGKFQQKAGELQEAYSIISETSIPFDRAHKLHTRYDNSARSQYDKVNDNYSNKGLSDLSFADGLRSLTESKALAADGVELGPQYLEQKKLYSQLKDYEDMVSSAAFGANKDKGQRAGVSVYFSPSFPFAHPTLKSGQPSINNMFSTAANKLAANRIASALPSSTVNNVRQITATLTGASLADSSRDINSDLSSLKEPMALKILEDGGFVPKGSYKNGAAVDSLPPEVVGEALSMADDVISEVHSAAKSGDDQAAMAAYSSAIQGFPELFPDSKTGLPSEIQIKGKTKLVDPADVGRFASRIDSDSSLSSMDKAEILSALYKDGTVTKVPSGAKPKVQKKVILPASNEIQ